jgi:hypothetical protein
VFDNLPPLLKLHFSERRRRERAAAPPPRPPQDAAAALGLLAIEEGDVRAAFDEMVQLRSFDPDAGDNAQPGGGGGGGGGGGEEGGAAHMRERDHANREAREHKVRTKGPPEPEGGDEAPLPDDEDGEDFTAALLELCKELGYSDADVEKFAGAGDFPQRVVEAFMAKAGIQDVQKAGARMRAQGPKVVGKLKALQAERARAKTAEEAKVQSILAVIGKCVMGFDVSWMSARRGVLVARHPPLPCAN